jgi:hypothetical protein
MALSDINGNGFGVGFPEQTVPLSALSGTWNLLEYAKYSSANGWVNNQYQLTLDATGKVTSLKSCTGTTAESSNCSPMLASDNPGQLKINLGGGFDVLNQDGSASNWRMFVFRNALGNLMLSMVPGGSANGFSLGSLDQAQSLPEKGKVSNNVTLQAKVSNKVMSITKNVAQFTVKEMDTTANSFTRVRDVLDGQPDGLVDTVLLDQPRKGLRFRAGGLYIPSGKVTSETYGNAIQMPIPGMGFTVSVGDGSTSKFLNLTVSQ